MYEILGICLALTALLALQIAGLLVALLCWLALRRMSERWRARSRVQFLLALRLAPHAVALVAVVAWVVPAYLAHEPRQSQDELSLPLVSLAVVPVCGVVLAFSSLTGAWRRTRQLQAEWLAGARPCDLEGISIPAFRFVHPFPVVAVVGVRHPRLFVAEQVFAELTDGELRSVVTHEAGHVIARDNLKRALLRFSSDLLPIVLYERALERAWSQAVEASADEHAVLHDRQAALDLAAALVKLARLAPPQACRAIPSAAFFTGDPSSGLNYRVRRLLHWTDSGAPGDPSRSVGLRLLAGAAGTAGLGALLHVASHPRLLAPLHAVLELVVTALR